MSIRTVPTILAAAVFAASLLPANAQPKPQPPQSLRLYVLDCGKITPATIERSSLQQNVGSVPPEGALVSSEDDADRLARLALIGQIKR